MKNLISSFIFLIFLLSCNSNEDIKTNDSFKIKGSIKNIPDSTVVIIQVNNIILDSAFTLSGKFELNSSVKEPVYAYLTVPSTNDYASFWLENTEIIFSAQSGGFLDAKIEGSALQHEEDSLFANINSISKTMDSLASLKSTDLNNVDEDLIYNKIDKLHNEMQKEEYLIVKNNSSSLISAYILNIYKTTWKIENVRKLYTAFSDKNKNSEYGKSINRFINVFADPRIGNKFTDFESKDVYGNIIRLSDFKGKVVLLDFWAAWCYPCRQENKNLVKTYNDYKKYGFEILGVSNDIKKEEWIKAIKEDKLIWTNVFDREGLDSKPYLIYGISGIPDNFLINKEGIIIARNLRGDDLRKKLDELYKND